MKRISIAVLLLLMLIVPVQANTWSDPVGDATTVLDVRTVTMTQTDRVMTGKIVMVDPVDNALFEEGSGNLVGVMLRTRATNSSYAYSYYLSVFRTDAGGLRGLLRGAPRDAVHEDIGEVAITKPAPNKLKFVLKRSMISGDRAGSRYHFWVETYYWDGGFGCGGMCSDVAPDVGEYRGRF